MHIAPCPFCKRPIVISEEQLKNTISIRTWSSESDEPISNCHLCRSHYGSYGMSKRKDGNLVRKYIFLCRKRK